MNPTECVSSLKQSVFISVNIFYARSSLVVNDGIKKLIFLHFTISQYHFHANMVDCFLFYNTKSDELSGRQISLSMIRVLNGYLLDIKFISKHNIFVIIKLNYTNYTS